MRDSVQRGRPSCAEVSEGSVLQHFLYKSRSNVQFIMPPFEPGFADSVSRRKWVIPKPSAAGTDRAVGFSTYIPSFTRRCIQDRPRLRFCTAPLQTTWPWHG
jgi:hypothetical protein